MGKSCKVVVCGQASVGKTSILEQLLYGNHVVGSEMIETQEDIYVGSIETDRGVREQVRFYDTRGLRDGAELPRHCFSCTDGYVLVYSTDSRESFQRVELLKKEIDKSKDKKEAVGQELEEGSRPLEGVFTNHRGGPMLRQLSRKGLSLRAPRPNT
ncbi:PREDICTED: NF-kappa-B inhibitor-interacting Ras-like protein 2 isoform X4 [Myotis brandtii]|uniref:NF-kappa-B inhibitor-interacting Ras-like protein 2 isoform X4 n=1 Tax=Myotis brandtii TaxID=109478 RepID=UPI0003BBE278|nr:PREDICTED: NF-kappa-B inhibitor-interacting Ras-like protein 2 isoform X4 [Myotis brandtii]